MSSDFSHLDARTAVDKIYSKSYATRLPKPSKLKEVSSSRHIVSLVAHSEYERIASATWLPRFRAPFPLDFLGLLSCLGDD